MEYPLIKTSWENQEIEALHNVIESGWFTCGKKVKELEDQFAQLCGAKYAVMSNSGSSANLLSIAAFSHKENHPLQPGDEVIVPAIGWATTYSPLHQYGLKLIFADVEKDTLNIDVEKVKKYITPKTKMIVAVNILGNPCALDQLRDICNKHSLLFFEDNCESMGATLNNKWCGRFGDIGTFSTFFSHHISTIEGGFSITDNKELYELMLCLRSHGWSRALPEHTTPIHRYEFLIPGYNLRPTELAGAVGIEQLKKLPHFIKKRRENAQYFVETFKNDPRYIIQKENGTSSWFSFTIILNPKIEIQRDHLVEQLKTKGIESRMITGGNFVRHPAIKHFNYHCPEPLENSDLAHDRGFFVGNFPHDIKKEIDLLYHSLDEIIGNQWKL